MRFFGTSKTTDRGTLEIGGCDVKHLVEKYGTPLYVIDEEFVRNNCRFFKKSFTQKDFDTEIIYASKAFMNIAICKLIKEEGLSLDVVSGGELYTAIKAEFPAEKIYFHGNNKSVDELALALEAKTGRIVVDNADELNIIEELCKSLNTKTQILLRLNPGVDAHTHKYIQTSKNDSKFGESINADSTYKIVHTAIRSQYIDLKGFHCHIGSQIFDETAYHSAVTNMIEFLSNIKQRFGFICSELNIGGGFGVYYTEQDKPMELDICLKGILQHIKAEIKKQNLTAPKVMIEPGRAIIANAGTTLYEAGGIKQTYGGKQYIFINGGMTDNLRTAMYDAKYEAVIANKLSDTETEIYTIAGKCCESGDIIIRDIKLPRAERGDIIAVLSTGAYNYSMASNYNKIPKPAVVFVKNNKARLVVKRETYEDIIRNDIE